ncbi:hypothetical protein BV898_18908 [Hypsibius exemplaris]|uniref:Uncharacterized protein n=1 Tax=Hypsibius exemplaris TaxID=2072580 RepID=A0A9X6NKI7_HYPEX|nr:hypothetical protein BV898_18908 [Hypsibius exemplaris]
MTRNNFPGRLRELLITCQLEDTLKSDFSKTGIFPFKPDIIKATLPLVQLKPVQRVYTALDPRFNRIAETMTLLGVPKRAREFLMSSIRRSIKGESIGSEVAIALSYVLASQKAPAKPRVPNRRGSFPQGSVITDQDFFASLVEKADNQKAFKALTKSEGFQSADMQDIQASSSQIVQNVYHFLSANYLNDAKKTSNEVEGLRFCSI